MKIAGIFDKHTAEVFKFLGVLTIQVNPSDTNLSDRVMSGIYEIKKNKDIFSVLISKNISSKIKRDLENFILTNSRPSIIEVDPLYNIDSYEDYESMIKRIIRETIGIRL